MNIKRLAAIVAISLISITAGAQTPAQPAKKKIAKVYPQYKPSCLICGKGQPPRQLRANIGQGTTDVMENPWTVYINGGTSTLNGPTNDGFLVSTGIRVAQHWDVRSDVFSLASNNTIVAIAGPEYFTSLAHFIPPNDYINTANIVPFINLKVGDAHGPVNSKIAYGIGGGFNLVLSPTLTLRPLDLSYIRSTVLANGQVVLGNHLQYAASVGLSF